MIADPFGWVLRKAQPDFTGIESTRQALPIMRGPRTDVYNTVYCKNSITRKGTDSMKLLTCRIKGVEQVGVLSQDGATIYPIRELGLTETTMNDLIRGFDSRKKQLLQDTAENGHPCGVLCSQTEPCAPIPHPVGNVICLGENYMQHAAESYRFQKMDFNGTQPHAVYFDKKVTCTLGSGEAIDGHLEFVTKLDYECELAVILGKDALHVREEDVDRYIFGYSVAKDISARDVQYRHKQNYLGKSLDTFFAMGPVIVTADEFPSEPALQIRCYVNGELRQNSFTDQVYFGIHHIVSELSQGMTLPAGTIIITGTPAGVGMGMEPPCFLTHGDVVTCEIDGIGRISNTVQ